MNTRWSAPNFHHDIVRKGVEHLMQEERTTHGALGRPSGARASKPMIV